MRTILTLSLAFSIGSTAWSQCNQAVPADALVVSTTTGGSYNGQNLWICPGANVGAAGNNNYFYIEQGGGAAVSGKHNILYSKSGIVYLGGDTNTVYYDGSVALISDNGNGNTLISCALVSFDYEFAPADGCIVGIEEQAAAVELSVYPDPVDDHLTISVGTGTTISQVRIVDMLGHAVGTYVGAAKMELDVSALQTGTYVVYVVTDKGEMVRPIVKRSFQPTPEEGHPRVAFFAWGELSTVPAATIP